MNTSTGLAESRDRSHAAFIRSLRVTRVEKGKVYLIVDAPRDCRL